RREFACHETGAAGAAGHAGDVEIAKCRAFFGELVEGGCLGIRVSIASQISEAQVVGKDEDDVRLFVGGSPEGCRAYEKAGGNDGALRECSEWYHHYFD